MPALGAWLALDIESEEVGQHSTTARGTLSLFGALPVKKIELHRYECRALIPGGELFGLRAPLSGVLVTSFSEVGDGRCPAREAGLRPGDLILSVDGVRIATAEEFSAVIASSGGRCLSLGIERGGQGHTLSLTPHRPSAEEAYRIGVTVKDSIAGIGTVTFIDPESGAYGTQREVRVDGILAGGQ